MFTAKMYVAAVVILSLFITLSLQACPQGWRESTIVKDKCYLVVVSKKIWFEAGAYCASAAPNGFLTSIQSAFESYSLNAIVTDTPSISSCDQLWIGANDFDQNGQFVWTDNNPFQYANWGAGQPDLNNQCVSSQSRTTGTWKTEPCGTENCFICETYTSSSVSSTSTTAAPSSPTIQYTTAQTELPMTSSVSDMTDCWDWLHIGGALSDGIYLINPSGSDPFNVYCDMTTNGGGWTLFQKRSDDSLVFYSKTWQEYKQGFNNGLQRNHWLGLDRLYLLSTKDPAVTLRIDLYGDRCQPNTANVCNPQFNPNGYWWGEYTFSIASEEHYYRLQTSIIQAGNLTNPVHDATSGFSYSNFGLFSTNDQDNSGFNCVEKYPLSGGWWNKACNTCALNGKYLSEIDQKGMYCEVYFDDNDYDVNPIFSEMKLRKQ